MTISASSPSDAQAGKAFSPSATLALSDPPARVRGGVRGGRRNEEEGRHTEGKGRKKKTLWTARPSCGKGGRMPAAAHNTYSHDARKPFEAGAWHPAGTRAVKSWGGTAGGTGDGGRQRERKGEK